MENTTDVIETNEQVSTDVQETNEPKTYSEEEVQKMIQSEADKRVSQALNKKENDYKAQLEAEKQRIAKEASMSEEEKFQAQLQAEREAFEAERAEFNKIQMKAHSLEELAKVGLPASFSSFIVATDTESVTENVKALKEAWDLELDKAITERLKGNTPKQTRTALDGSDVLTKEDFFNLPYKQRMAMLADDAELLNKLK